MASRESDTHDDDPIVIDPEVWVKRLEWLIAHKTSLRQKSLGGEGWIIVNDEVLIVHQFDNPPAWLKPILELAQADDNFELPPGIRVHISYDGTPEEVPA